jgi:hypothetical protein
MDTLCEYPWQSQRLHTVEHFRIVTLCAYLLACLMTAYTILWGVKMLGQLRFVSFCIK